MNRNILLLSVAFGLIFFSYSGAQQFLTLVYRQIGRSELGFLSLGVVYTAFSISNLLVAPLVVRFGPKKMMIVGTLAYTTFIAALQFPVPLIIIISSALLGIGGAALWNSHGVYIVQAAGTKRGVAAGIFTTIWSLSTVAGIILTGWALDHWKQSSQSLFYLLSLGPILALIPLWKLDPLGTIEHKAGQLNKIIKLVKNRAVLRLSLIWVLMIYTSGFLFSSMPILLSSYISLSLVGILGSLQWVLAAFLSVFTGNLADRIGITKMVAIGVLFYLVGGIMLISISQLTLILASIILAVAFAIVRTTTFAIIGEVASTDDQPALVAVTTFLSNIGAVAAILLGGFNLMRATILVMIVGPVLTALLALPLLALSPVELKKRLAIVKPK